MALAYTAPTWEDGSGTGISASQLQALCNCIEGLVQGSDKAVSDIAMNASVITLTFADGTQETVNATNLKSISSIAKTGTEGLVDTYTITYNDGTTSTFTVTNGAAGTAPTITMTATADATSSANPTVTVTRTGSDASPNFAFAFSGLKGAKGDTGATGATGADGQNGTDGVSPEVTIGTITGGHSVTITDADHPSGQTFDVMDGQDGQDGTDGTDGTDGYSPVVTITPITGGNRVNITDADHPSGQNFDVMNGTGSGDMLASVYDSTSAVASAGGIADYVASQIPSISGKADKVTSATSGNFAGLDANGNLTDSGSKASDFKAASAHDSWSDVTNKPFNTVGAGLSVSSNALTAAFSSYRDNGVPSATAYHSQQIQYAELWINIDGTVYMQTTTKTTSSGVDSFAFSNNVISSSSAIDVYCDVFGVSPTDIVVASGSCTVKFNSSDNVGTCRIYIR